MMLKTLSNRFSRRRQVFVAGSAGFSLIAAVFLGLSATASHAASADQVRSLYGDRIEFGIYRDGSPVGKHEVRFEEQDGGLRVQTEFDLAVSALFITLFRLDYQSDAVWRDGQLVALEARTDQNGTVANVRAQADEGVLKITGPNGLYEADLGLFPTNHWNAGVVGSQQVLNTITGRVADVRLVPVGVEKVDTAHGVIDATRYRYEGAIQNEVWYDSNGRWVQMRFLGQDGSNVELRCRKCKATETAEASF
ncbi:DUF6134 family protein [Pyruvatibacter sp.]|uniref:DUF6134 family protein n=1 Tax=Pyruvatibacter sp. TaxID=1981328 RepID=UPI003264771E